MAAAAAELRPRVEELIARRSRNPWKSPRLAFRSEPRPVCVLLDLAIQAAGAVSVPMEVGSSEAVSGEDVEAWVEPPELLDPERPAPREAVWPEGLPVDPPGGVVVRDADGAPREISAAELSAAARELADRIRDGQGRESGSRPRPPSHGVPSRDIVVSARPLDDPGERRLLAWALRTGAAVVLEPSRESHVATARWVRPTVFAGDGAEVEALARAAETYRSPFPRRLGRWLRRRVGREAAPALPFDRLHTVLVRNPAAATLSESRARAWEDRGVRVLGLPSG